MSNVSSQLVFLRPVVTLKFFYETQITSTETVPSKMDFSCRGFLFRVSWSAVKVCTYVSTFTKVHGR